ncbi:GTP 3',8-cyclase MoaA [Chlorobaculum sp. MV4-Y]|uniref:GTP 3',8-cyclase MoaA n=1 Tax=Chlorobaculum sp. MV4-Y TaxID=2976335 RepID=UPI0021B058E5|nr:GTP 3',8-cyclase MoaA [Chlorobaculum sp. MV4-Y]UWX58295.1 GTP 3',8-cyclase MoaA [Chlorobaculum sp. MV4-Y]
MLTDRFGRVIDYARIAVTSACNLRCAYCLRDEAGAPQKTQQLDMNEAWRLIRVLAGMGVRKIRFTGGEPLLHPGITELVKLAKSAPGIETVKITTNGVLLDRQLDALVEAGLDGVNLSLDTLDREKFISITRRDRFEQVSQALDRLITTPGLAIKLNTLLLRGINSDEIPAFVELTREHDVTVRFMELQPFDDQQIWRTGRFMGAEMIRKQLVGAYPELKAVTGHSTEHYSFRLPDHRGSIAIIPAFSRNFCSSCSKLRITADARLISCLYHHESIDLAPVLKGKMNEEEIKKWIIEAVQQKPKDGLKSSHDTAASSMSRIGG